MKTIKKFAMSLLGGGIAVAALAFTLMSAGVSESQKLAQQEFGMEVLNPGQPNEQINWIPLAHLEETDYECQEAATTCTGTFNDSQIDPSTNKPYPNETPSVTKPGRFELL